MDLGNPEFVTGVATRGQPDLPNWVTKFTVSTTVDGITFEPYMDTMMTSAKVFSGNFDSNTIVKAFFDREVPTLAVRIYPVDWNGAIALRFDVLSCSSYASTPVTPAITQPTPGGTTPVIPPTPFPLVPSKLEFLRYYLLWIFLFIIFIIIMFHNLYIFFIYY